MPKKKSRIRPKKEINEIKNICMRCEKQFTSRKALITHSKAHLQALHELKMLEEGHVPVETKLGGEFKGKNKIIVS